MLKGFCFVVVVGGVFFFFCIVLFCFGVFFTDIGHRGLEIHYVLKVLC